MSMKKKLHVGLLFGGRSTEHDISIASARSVALHLRRSRYIVHPVYVTREGRWVFGSPAAHLLRSTASVRRPRGIVGFQAVAQAFSRIDIVVPVFHGPFGEDGTIQGLLEFLGIPYTGSGVLASALAMDKIRCRHIFAAAGIPIARGMAVHQPKRSDMHQILRTIGLPLVVKPNRGGSTIGTTIVRSHAQLYRALSESAVHDPTVLIERFVAGRELTVPVLGNRRPQALPVIEIIASGGVFDLYAKYAGVADGRTRELCPAPLSRRIAVEAQRLAVAAHIAVGCYGLSRTDMILRSTGSLIVLEINTLPGFTKDSLAPKAARAAGIPFSRLLDRLIDEALAISRPSPMPR